jgi:hypothetical protein
VTDFKEIVESVTGVPVKVQKLMCKGLMKNEQTLRECKGCPGGIMKVMLIGCTIGDIIAVNTTPTPAEMGGASGLKDALTKEPLCKQKQHAKIIEKGVPDDVMPGILNGRDPLPEIPICGMLNKTGGKVRLTFKLETDELWIGTKERTNKIPMAQISNVISEPIDNFKQYHIMAIQLGPTEASRYWLYWVPAQYVASIKDAILGPGH